MPFDVVHRRGKKEKKKNNHDSKKNDASAIKVQRMKTRSRKNSEVGQNYVSVRTTTKWTKLQRKKRGINIYIFCLFFPIKNAENILLLLAL